MDPIFNMFKVKFSKLDEIISNNCEISQDSKIKIFINLEPIFRKLLASKVDEYLKIKNDEKILEMVSNIINLASHYRLFFTKNKLYSQVYLYMGYPFKEVLKNKSLNPKYRDYYKHKFTKDPRGMILGNTLNDAIPLVKVIIEYIEGVYFIESNSLESSLIPQVITDSEESNTVNFILTNDRYDYQYTNKDFYIIRPKQNESYVINKSNLIRILKLEDKIVNDIDIPSHFYPFILCLLGDKYRNIDKIKRMGLSTLIKTINSAIEENIIGKDVTNINILANMIKKEYQGLVLTNFYTVDLDSQMQLLNLKDKYVITSQITDKFDNATLKRINNDYFQQYPIQLIELTSANNLIKKTKKTDIFL